MITIGILYANLINYGAAQIKGGSGWHVSLALAAMLAATMVVATLFLPDTPTPSSIAATLTPPSVYFGACAAWMTSRRSTTTSWPPLRRPSS